MPNRFPSGGYVCFCAVIKTIQCASLQENLTMTFSSYLQRTKLFWKAVSQRFRLLLLIATFSVLMMRVASPIWIHLIFPCYHKIVNSLYQIYQKWLTWNVLYQMFCHKNPDPSNFFSSDQKSNMLSSQNVPSSEHSFLRPLFKTSNHDNVQSTPLPSTMQETGSEKASLDEDDKPNLQSLQSPPPIEKVLYDQTNTKEQSKLKCATSRTTAKLIIR